MLQAWREVVRTSCTSVRFSRHAIAANKLFFHHTGNRELHLKESSCKRLEAVSRDRKLSNQMSQEDSCNSSQGSNFSEEFSTGAFASVASDEGQTHNQDRKAAAATDVVDVAENNERMVRCFYDTLAGGNTGLLSHLLAEDLDLWFHGPRCHQHMSKLLTGITSFRAVTLSPSSILATHNVVVVEGESGGGEVTWVHIWTVEEGKLIQLREFWNTALAIHFIACLPSDLESPPPVVWHSKLWQAVDNTKPGLILTI